MFTVHNSGTAALTLGAVTVPTGFTLTGSLSGSLAPEGAVVKKAAVAPEMLTHSGPARVFEQEEAALAAIARGASVVRVHDVAETVQALRVWQAIGGEAW